MSRLAVLLLASLNFFSAGVSAAEPMHLMVNTSPPYADRKLPEQGLAVEMVNHVFARTDYRPEITIENWSRAVEGARIGVYDGLAAAWYSEDRNQDMLFSQPYLESQLVLLKLTSNPRQFGRLEDLSGTRLGVRTDYAYGIDFKAIQGVQLVEESHLVQNLLNLLNGKVDLVIGDRRTVVHEIHEFMQDRILEFSVLPVSLPVRERHLAVSRDYPEHAQVVAAFNAALQAAQEDGSLEAIVKRWDDRLGDIRSR